MYTNQMCTKTDLIDLLPKKRWSLRSDDGDVVPITSRELLVGRSESCDLIINENFTSSMHAKLIITPLYLRVIDLNSSNGTKVNGESITNAQISHDDTVTFGNTSYYVVDAEVLNPHDSTGELIPPSLSTTISDDNEQEELVQKAIAAEIINNIDADDPNLVDIPVVADIDISETEQSIQGAAVSVDDEFDANSLAKELDREIRNKDENVVFIFEDDRETYPVFDYNIDQFAVEVTAIYDDITLSVDFLPIKEGTYYFWGRKTTRKKFNIDSIRGKKKYKFLEISKDKVVTLFPMENHELSFFAAEGRQGSVNDITKLEKGDQAFYLWSKLRVSLRIVSTPPKFLAPPFLGRDKQFRKLLLIFLGFGLLLMGIVLQIDTTDIIEPTPPVKKITKILYRKPKKKLVQPKPVETQMEKKLVTTKSKKKKKLNKTPPKAVLKPQKTKAKVIKKNRTLTKKISKKLNTTKKVIKNPSKNTFKKFDFSKSINMFKTTKSRIKTVAASGAAAEVGQEREIRSVNTAHVSLTGTRGVKSGLINNKYNLDTSTGLQGAKFNKSYSFPSVHQETVTLSSMDPNLIRDILRRYIPQFRFCYDQELVKIGKKIKGTIDLSFVITARGKVVSPRVSMRKFRMSSIGQRCIKDVLRLIKFPKPKGGGIVEVKQPINFEPEP